ncbi:DUF2087 domain-containing protein [Streptomyces sp. NPDC090077]|uniref:DUF2087 domain-containing protein n=1 Tax=Streptomyces sp. NPDC090077 TaxID=3365938 RepID=UPI003814C793
MSQITDHHSTGQHTTDQRESAEQRQPRGVADLFSGGRLVAIPRKAARREQLLEHLSETLFAPDRAYSEPEVNDALRTVHEDCSALRRYLITSGRLTRTRDGSSYRRATTTR